MSRRQYSITGSSEDQIKTRKVKKPSKIAKSYDSSDSVKQHNHCAHHDHNNKIYISDISSAVSTSQFNQSGVANTSKGKISLLNECNFTQNPRSKTYDISSKNIEICQYDGLNNNIQNKDNTIERKPKSIETKCQIVNYKGKSHKTIIKNPFSTMDKESNSKNKTNISAENLPDKDHLSVERIRRISGCSVSSDKSDDNRPQFFIGSYDEKEKTVMQIEKSREAKQKSKRKALENVRERTSPVKEVTVIKRELSNGHIQDANFKNQVLPEKQSKEVITDVVAVCDSTLKNFKADSVEESGEESDFSQNLKNEDDLTDDQDNTLEDITPMEPPVIERQLTLTDANVDQDRLLIDFSPTVANDPDNRKIENSTDMQLTKHIEDNFISDTNIEEDLHSNSNGNIPRPDSLSLPRPLQFYERQQQKTEDDVNVSASPPHRTPCNTDDLLEAVTSTPLQDQGTLMQDGDMIAFVAEDLAEKIRMSSPLTKNADTPTGSSHPSGSGTPSSYSISSANSLSSSTTTSGWTNMSTSGMSRSPSVLTQSPEDIPPIDPRVVIDLELNAKRVADSLNLMMCNLKSNLHKMSSLTTGCMGAYQQAIDTTCDTVDASIKSMYALMAKCEELSKNMHPIYKIAEQIKEMKRLLDLFEAQLAKDETKST